MSLANVSILVVDDDKVDAMSIKAALEENKISNPIYVARDGVEAFEMLRGASGTTKIPYPLLILLDLNMPRMNGIEFLKELRQDPKLHTTVVFVLTTSDDDKDKTAAYQQHIAGYLVKSKVGVDFINVVKLLEDFKIAVQFPSGE